MKNNSTSKEKSTKKFDSRGREIHHRVVEEWARNKGLAGGCQEGLFHEIPSGSLNKLSGIKVETLELLFSLQEKEEKK